ncbi:MAG: replicative DNA helicase [Isosphaeraceae bacterium]
MATSLEDRMPPQNLEAEQGVLGSVLLDPTAMHDVAAILAPEHFYRDAYGLIYRAILDQYDAGRPLDTTSLADALERQGTLERVGGHDALFEILGATPHAANAVYFAQIIRSKATLRELAATCLSLASDTYRHDHTAEQLLERAEREIYRLAELESQGETRPVGQFVDVAMERLGNRRDGEVAGVGSGLRDLDELTDGFHPGQLIVIAARPSMGKSALALNICEAATIAAGVAALFVSLEMSGVELAERLLVAESRVDGHRVKTGRGLSHANLDALHVAAGGIKARARLWIDDTPIRTVGQIAANARRHKARNGVSLVVVDYIQLIDPGSDARKSNRQEQVAAMSRRLKTLAKELSVPVIALSQLNRQSEQREDRRPRLADLRESGAIEQDADMVLLLHRPEFYDPNDQPGMAELIVAKNRNGGTGTVKLAFRKSLMRFENCATHAGDVPDFGPIPDDEPWE